MKIKKITIAILFLMVGMIACSSNSGVAEQSGQTTSTSSPRTAGQNEQATPNPRFTQQSERGKVQGDFVEYKGVKYPKAKSYVNDFEKAFTREQSIELNKKIKAYESQTSNEIAIVTVADIKPAANIKDYATNLLNAWGIGKVEKNNGLLIVFSKSLRKVHIATGYGTEKVVTDEICKKLINETILPEFKNDNYYGGIEKGVTELMSKWN